MKTIRLIIHIPLMMGRLEMLIKTKPTRMEISSIFYEVFEMQLQNMKTIFNEDKDLEYYEYHFHGSTGDIDMGLFHTAIIDMTVNLPDFQPSVADLFKEGIMLNIGRTFGGADKFNTLFQDEFLAGTFTVERLGVTEGENKIINQDPPIGFTPKIYALKGFTELTNIGYSLDISKKLFTK